MEGKLKWFMWFLEALCALEAFLAIGVVVVIGILITLYLQMWLGLLMLVGITWLVYELTGVFADIRTRHGNSGKVFWGILGLVYALLSALVTLMVSWQIGLIVLLGIIPIIWGSILMADLPNLMKVYIRRWLGLDEPVHTMERTEEPVDPGQIPSWLRQVPSAPRKEGEEPAT